MKYQYTFTVSEYEDLLEQKLDSNIHIAMSGVVDIMNELLLSEHVRFMLSPDNTICLMDVRSNQILKDIPKQEIMRLARELGVLQSLVVH